MTAPARYMKRSDLLALDLPPDSPEDVKYRDDVHLDEHVRTLKYTQLRRCVFTDRKGATFAVEYEAPLDTGDFEAGEGQVENHGWTGSVLVVEVELRPVVVERWMPVRDSDSNVDPDSGADPVAKHLTELYLETGVRDRDAADYAAETLAQTAREFATLLEPRHPDAAAELRTHAGDLQPPRP